MQSPAAGDAVVWLELGPSPGRVRVGAEGSQATHSLPVGTQDVAAIFRRDPPTEGELEAAIDVVEEAVMPLAKLLPRGAVLVAASDLAVQLVELSTGSAASRAASVEAVEALFEQMALAARRGAWPRELRMDAPLCAGLLILREFMHHAGFERIEVRPA